MKNETRLSVKLPADLLAVVHAKAADRQTTVSALVRKFLVTYATTNWEADCDLANPIYTYQETAQRKRELKEETRQLHAEYAEAKQLSKVDKKYQQKADNTREQWKRSIDTYNTFCSEYK